MAGADGWTWRDAGALATAARALLWIDAAMSLGAVAVSLTMGPDALIDGNLAGPFGWAQRAAGLGALIAFLCWLYRANANARALGATDLMGSPGLSVAWFFIPLAFLFMPYVVVRDTWRASLNPKDWQGQGTPPSVILWWICFLGAAIAGTISFRLGWEASDDLYQAVGVADLANNLLSIPAALLGAWIVGRVQAIRPRLVS